MVNTHDEDYSLWSFVYYSLLLTCPMLSWVESFTRQAALHSLVVQLDTKSVTYIITISDETQRTLTGGSIALTSTFSNAIKAYKIPSKNTSR